MTETVDHERYGTGTVEGERYQGFELHVCFANGIKKWVRRSELKKPAGQDNSPIRGSVTSDTVGQETSGKTAPLHQLYGGASTPHPPAERGVIEGRYIDAASEPAQIGAANMHADAAGRPEVSHTCAVRGVSSAGADERFASRVIIEALRLGGVPHDMVEQFTAGRDRELKQIREWLESSGGCLLIDGDYGAGKSHMLELTASHALHDGWAVARVEMDPQETPFHKPRQLYQKIIGSLEYYSDGRRHDFRDLLTYVAESPGSSKVQALKTHPYFATFVQNWRMDAGNEDLWDWIKGDGGRPRGFFPRFLNYQLAANIYCNLLNGLGWIAENILGLKGLLILIDEAECIDRSFYSAYQYRSAINTLNGLILMANIDKSLIQESAQEDAIDYRAGIGHFGHYSGLRYPGDTRHRFSYVWKDDTHIKIALAFVPEFFESLGLAPDLNPAVREVQTLRIEPLSDIDHAFLLKRIMDIYREAYRFTPEKNVFNHLPQQKTRIFVKAAIEALDLMRFHPDRDLQDLMTP